MTKDAVAGWVVLVGVLVAIGTAGRPILIIVASVVGVCLAVLTVNLLGSITSLLVIPRTRERWGRLHDDDRDPGRSVALYEGWQSITPLEPPEAATWGFLVGFAWSAVVLTPAYFAARSHIRYPGLVFLSLVLLFAVRAAQTSVANNLLLAETRACDDEPGGPCDEVPAAARTITQPVPHLQTGRRVASLATPTASVTLAPTPVIPRQRTEPPPVTAHHASHLDPSSWRALGDYHAMSSSCGACGVAIGADARCRCS